MSSAVPRMPLEPGFGHRIEDDEYILPPGPVVYAHGIWGGGEFRHAGCSGKCCEAVAEVVEPGRLPFGGICGGCEGSLTLPARALDFDRDAVCESCQEAAVPS